MKTGNRVAAAVAAVALASAGAARGAAVSSLDDIHYWVGEGTNRCGVVVDWSEAFGEGATLAWGYRWNGVCTNLSEVLVRIGREDPRLKIGVQGMTSQYVDFYFFGYDVNDNHPQWDVANGAASDPDALVLREDSVDYSAWWVLYGPLAGADFPTAEQTSSWTAANGIVPRDADWFVLRWGATDWPETAIQLPAPVAAESPYGYQVTASRTDETNTRYNSADSVLGHPTMYMDGQWGGPVTPANPAWFAGEVFSLVSDGDEEDGPGYVTIAFDHDVVDDPANPFGLDFIVFGNTGITLADTSDYISQLDDPSLMKLTSKGWSELAKVEVSQDGKTWYTSEEWKTSDGFAPTCAYLYEPERADPRLFDGNLYWGRAALATRPVDPRMDFSDVAGYSVADLSRFYNGSAGGTGYDLALATDASGNELPKKNGRKWIRYVRISGVYADDLGDGDSGYTEPEVDAVADVAPVSGYEKWVEANYTDWTTLWRSEVAGPEALAANGQPNAVNYFLGLSASESASAFEFRIRAFEPGETMHRIRVVTNRRLESGCGVVVKRADSLTAGTWTDEVPQVEDSAPLADGTGWETTFVVSADGGAFFKLALEVE
ncbi:MAG: hypothetical protein ACI4Q3_09180 [Kiritimatiellia bacterium]